MSASEHTEAQTTQEEHGWRERVARLRQTRTWRWGVELVMVAAIFLGVSAWQTRHLLSRAEPAPSVALTRLADGQPTSLEALRGKKTALVLWAPWCGVCKAEVGALNALAESLGDDAQLVSVALSYEDRADVEGFIREQGVRYPVLLGDARATKALRVSAFPTIYILDAQGRISASVVGYTPSWTLRLRLWWA
jgi:thiol-disulfide isomerase/thioredoxin